MFDWFTKWITKKKPNVLHTPFIHIGYRIHSNVSTFGSIKMEQTRKKSNVGGKVYGYGDLNNVFGSFMLSFIPFIHFFFAFHAILHFLLLFHKAFSMCTEYRKMFTIYRITFASFTGKHTFYTSWFNDFIRHFNWDWLCSYRIENVHHNFKSNKS